MSTRIPPGFSSRALLITSIAVLVAAAVYIIAPEGAAQGPRTHVVVVNDGRFEPAELTVFEGDTVTFKNTGSKDAWPASDPHPTHEFLSGFETLEEVPPGGSWSYVFSEPGSWRYHDHLSPSAQGEIVVLGENARTSLRNDGKCDGKCFDELVRDVVEKDGIDAAYALFQRTYEAGALPRSCHWTAHKIGEATYEMYREGRTFPLSRATSFCGYGFYHGFLEGLLREDPSPSRALEFCDSVQERLGTLGLQNCYHGIGHGYTEDPPEIAAVGDFGKMVAPGIRMCEFLFGKNFTDLNLCLTGVFTVPAGFAADGTYGLALDPERPFAYCAKFPERYLKACYGEFAPKLDTILNWDITKLPRYLEGIRDERLRRLVIWVVPSVTMAKHIQDENLDRYVLDCRATFEGLDRRICWGGALLGIFSHGEPEKQYEQALRMCASDAWLPGEKDFCYGESFRQMRMQYSAEHVESACKSAPEAYRRFCFDEAKEHESPYEDPSFE